MRSQRGVTPIDLLVGTTAVALLLGFCMLGLGEMKPKPKRERCAAQLRGLGQAMYIYAQDDPQTFPAIGVVRRENDGAMVIFDPKNRTSRPSTAGIPSPTVDIWVLLRQNNTTRKQLICPATKDVPDPAEDPTAYYDFASPKNLSYAYQYQHDPNRRVLGTSSEPTFPLMADANPYIKGEIKEEILKDRLSEFKGNSTNHSTKIRAGQNVLFQDGHVVFEKSPDVGLSGKASPDLEKAKASRKRDDCYTVYAEEKDAVVDPGAAAPTATKCNLGGKSDACLVP